MHFLSMRQDYYHVAIYGAFLYSLWKHLRALAMLKKRAEEDVLYTVNILHNSDALQMKDERRYLNNTACTIHI